jgi:hypothetical protein
LNAEERPAHAAERPDLLLLCVVQDVAHLGEGLHPPNPRQRLGPRQLIAGFEVSINCRFWVSTEAASIQHEYNEKLETAKAQLQAQNAIAIEKVKSEFANHAAIENAARSSFAEGQ